MFSFWETTFLKYNLHTIKITTSGYMLSGIVLYQVFILLRFLLLFAGAFHAVLFIAGAAFLASICILQRFAETVGKGEVGYAAVA